jgi:hypothetical protein
MACPSQAPGRIEGFQVKVAVIRACPCCESDLALLVTLDESLWLDFEKAPPQVTKPILFVLLIQRWYFDRQENSSCTANFSCGSLPQSSK